MQLTEETRIACLILSRRFLQLNVSIFLRFKRRVLLQACSCQLLDMLKMMVSLNPKEFAPLIWKVKCTVGRDRICVH
ncbi:hypothetical protein RIF29_09223 [Crotalaria pallida]|uniref:Uncharacterized protein n=1 Tax=Crotalaria pallida TaxID=3830 RepID=A0AAN9ILM0_CROPI